MVEHENESDWIKLYWQVQALRGQIFELERERERVGNLLWLMRQLIVTALTALGEAEPLGKKNDAELLSLFDQQLKTNWRFSRCPNAEELHCRPASVHMTRDGDLIYCDDCGWDIRDEQPPLKPPTLPEVP